jgi:cytochrome P450
MVSRIVHGRVGGRALTHEEMHQVLTILLFGGLDTVASAMGFMSRFLAEHPGHRRELVEEPALIPSAIEEMFRRFGVSTTGRIIARDTAYKGIELRKGDVMHVFAGLHGLDERVFPDPLTVDFRRKAVQHATFGNGVHRCPGSFLARTEIKVFLQEWLARIPDFRVKPGERVVTSSGMVNGVLYLPLVWDVPS